MALRRPALARSLLRSQCMPDIVRSTARRYQTSSDPTELPFAPVETSILSSALRHVPNLGFTSTALAQGARDAGYLDVSTNIFTRGPFDLVNYHLVTQRLALKNVVQFPDGNSRVGAKVRTLALGRLRSNAGIIHKWQEAIALMSLPSNLPASLAELARLSDEIWFLAGDKSVDTSWYTKRATLSAIYSSTELFMTTDTSPDFVETENFLDRRLEEIQSTGGAVRALGEWTKFSAQALVNVARSKGVRI